VSAPRRPSLDNLQTPAAPGSRIAKLNAEAEAQRAKRPPPPAADNGAGPLEAALRDAKWTKGRLDNKENRHWNNQGVGQLTVYADGHIYVHKPVAPLKRREYSAVEVIVELLGGATEWEWSEPTPLTDYADLPPFPDSVLPSRLGPYARALARSTQTPLDLCAVMMLGALSAAAGGRALVNVRPDWTEPVNVYCAVVAASGERKSAVVTAIAAPFWDFERDRAESVKADITEKVALKAAAVKAREKATTALATAEPDGQHEAMSKLTAAIDAVESIEVPVPLRLLADDATPEALVSLMAEQHGRMAVLSPEGGDVFDLIGGRYSGEPNLGIYLKAHAGEPYRTDRKGRPPEFVERPALTLALAVQPDVVTSIARVNGFRGRGLLARFLYSWPASIVGRRDASPPPVDGAVALRYSDLMTKLLTTMAEWGDDPMRLALTPDALEVAVEYLDRVEARLGPDGAYAAFRDWGGKLVGASVRLAALFHIAELVSQEAQPHREPIAADTMRAGVEVAEYLSAHAFAAFGLMGADPAVNDAEAVLRWIEREEHTEFSRRDAHVALRARFIRADQLDGPLNLLEATGWIRRLPPVDPSPRGGRPPSPVFEVNTSAHNAHNAHNPPS
jgi:replicative DNA helicase